MTELVCNFKNEYGVCILKLYPLSAPFEPEPIPSGCDGDYCIFMRLLH
jgi:hypothetical protein